MIDVDPILAEIRAGLANETTRRDRAQVNLDFYRGDFDAYLSYPDDGEYQEPPHKRTSLLMQRVLVVLSGLYAKGPAREIADDPELSAWLTEQYQREGVDGLLQEADRLALAAEVCAVQVVGPDDQSEEVDALARPVRFQLWPANSFVVWVDPADPTRAAAVATIDTYDNQRRLRLWTPAERYTFLTGKLAPGQTAGGTAFTQVAEPDENYYGVLPFAFVHANPPATDFWSHGPGDVLRAANDYLNHDLTDLGDSLGYARKPILASLGNDSQPPKPLRPGSIWHLNPSNRDEAGNLMPPSLDYLQPDLGFVEASWADLQSYIDHSLEMVGCPPSVIRLAGDPAKSGAALLTEQMPLVAWAVSRQRAFAAFERDLARATIAVGGAELGPARLRASTRAKLDSAQADRLTLRWPSMQTEPPQTAAEQAEQDAADLASGFTTLVKVVMRRLSCSRDEALAYLESNREDEAELVKRGIKPKPPTTPPPATDPENDDDGRDQEDEPERPGEPTE